jgi:protein O-mannosyl-transferase
LLQLQNNQVGLKRSLAIIRLAKVFDSLRVSSIQGSVRRLATKSNPAPPRAATPVVRRPQLPVWVMAGLLVLGTIALYWPTIQCEFVLYDDPEFLTENPHVQGGLNWEGVKWAFRNTEQAAYWAPLMWLSHMLAWQLFGMNAWGHHLINVLLHAVNTALVFLVFRRLTRATWRSLMVAALFGWHPLRVESVAWVTERKDVLSMLFWILALWGYAKYVEGAPVQSSKSNLWYGASLGMFVLGLMSKPVLVVTLPCVLLLLDYWPLRRLEPSTLYSQLVTVWRLVREKVPFFVLAAAASGMTVLAEEQRGALASNAGLPLGARSGNGLISYCRYLGNLFWPTDLAVFYPRPGDWPLEQVLLAGGVLLGLSVLFFMQRRRYPYLLVGWLWFLGVLVPVIGLVQAGAQAMADRFTYVPSLGVLILAIWGTNELTRHWRYHGQALSVVAAAAVMLCMALTRQSLGYWKDDEALFRHALEVTESNWLAHNNLGYALGKRGQSDEAIRQYQAAIRLKPNYAEAHSNLGAALNNKGQIDEAIRQFQETMRLKPNVADVHSNLGAALDKKGQSDEAIRQYHEALRLKPDHAEAHNNLGAALGKKGQVDEAIRQYQEALRLKPDYAEAHNNLGTALGRKGQSDEAIRHYQEALHLKPNYAEAHNNLGLALGQKGQVDEAIRHYREALRLKPDLADAHYNLGAALDDKGQTDEAIRHYQAALRLKPDYAEAHYNLGNALGRKGQSDEAIRHYQEALRLKPDHAEAHNNLGIAFYHQRRTDEAIGQFQEALRLRPDFAGAHRNLDVVLAARARASPPPGGATNP